MTDRTIQKSPVRLIDRKDVHKLFSWGRYLYWAEIQRKEFIDYNGKHQSAEGPKAEWFDINFAVEPSAVEGSRLSFNSNLAVLRLITGWPV
jgi:hypothetical protein